MEVSGSLFLKTLTIHNDWESFLTENRIFLLKEIELQVGKDNFTPSAEKVMRFLELPLSTAKVVILGQDPYPQPGAATGRAFEVGNLKSWNAPFKNISLKNILRAIYKTYSEKILNYTDLKAKFDNEFPVLPPQKLFVHWEKQGVLLLNTSFTCKPGIPGSHKKIWENFTTELLDYINRKSPLATWFIWGNHALGATSGLDIKNKIFCQHPMMCFDGPDRETDFLYGTTSCFKIFKNEIDWTGFGFNSNFKSGETLF